MVFNMNNDRIKELKNSLGQDFDEKDFEKFVITLKKLDNNDFSILLDNLPDKSQQILQLIYEMRYYSNRDRTLKQILESKFYFLYLLTKKKNRNLKTALINIRGYRSIKIHRLFDIGYYLENNPDVRESGDDPLMHYIYYGFKEGRNPSANFDGEYYFTKYPDTNKTNLNPLIHYSLYGREEGRSTTKK
jgi:hypothetical protein